jgi:3D (Asp-Asp-Asp) domain-containing protein
MARPSDLRSIALALGLAAVALFAADAGEAGEAAEKGEAPASYLGDFQVTYYWVAVEAADDGAPADEVLLDAAGGEIARVSAAFRRALDREGTGRLRDGRVLNVGRRVDGAWRYLVLAPGSFGLGAGGIDLTPFRSVASDPAEVPTGSRLFLPALEGLALPDGSRHDGIVEVCDVGASVRGPHLDLFIALVDYLPLFERRAPSRATTPVFLADACR